ncbi:MAG: hypothetical protein ACKO5E_09305 [bacterium]
MLLAMDIEDIIKAIAPFAFIIFWVASSVIGSIKQGQPAKTSRPVFKQPPWAEANQAPKPAARPASVWESLVVDDDDVPYDEWQQEPPPKRTVERPIQRNFSAELTALERVRQLIEERAATASSTGKTAAPARPAEDDDSGDRQSVNYNQMVGANLSHLVSDHAADVHLQNLAPASLAEKSVAKPYADLMNRLKKPESARDALVMSIVLGEPKSRQRPLR